MADIKTNRELVGEWRTERVTFDAKDSKGRVIGVAVHRCEVNFVSAPADQRMFYTIAPGFYYSGKVTATRDGGKYGAGQPEHYFTTEAEREAYITKRIESSRKAAMKKVVAA